MRTEEEVMSMTRHPTAISDGSGSTAEVADGAPFGTFFQALSDLDDAVKVYGPRSSEVASARVRVERTRNVAIAVWRLAQPAA